MKNIFAVVISLLLCGNALAQNKLEWGDMNNGHYQNPILNADYSDPDVIRVGEKYYMVASDFHFIGMQVLESDDMINWHVISQIYDRFNFDGWDTMTKYAAGSWAPSIRYHDGKFWVFFCTPDEGLMMSVATNPAGPWSNLHCVKNISKWEDPCPLWDDDGKAYLGHSVHRAGPIIVHRMSNDGKTLLDDGKVVYRGPVAEGTKWLKRNGYYYLIIPEGGVSEGWQTVLRSRDIYGPYEKRVVLEQGSTDINGPHQGALVDTPDGEWWFYHFQSVKPSGRVVHLQPARWVDDWLMVGVDYDKNGIGEPVREYTKPNIHVSSTSHPSLPATSDEFDIDKYYYRGQNKSGLALQWQWCHNPINEKWSLTEKKGWLTMHAVMADSLKASRNMLTQKTMGYTSEATTKIDAREITDNCYAGLLYTGKLFRAIGVCRDGVFIEHNGIQEVVCKGNFKTVYLRVNIDNETNKHQFFYSLNNRDYIKVGDAFAMTDGYWKGTRVGLFCYNKKGNKGTARFDYFHYVINR